MITCQKASLVHIQTVRKVFSPNLDQTCLFEATQHMILDSFKHFSGPKYKIIRSSSPYPKVCTLETVSDGQNCEYLSKMDINQLSRDHQVIDHFKNFYNFPRYANSGRTRCRSPFVDILSQCWENRLTNLSVKKNWPYIKFWTLIIWVICQFEWNHVIMNPT